MNHEELARLSMALLNRAPTTVGECGKCMAVLTWLSQIARGELVVVQPESETKEED